MIENSTSTSNATREQIDDLNQELKAVLASISYDPESVRMVHGILSSLKNCKTTEQIATIAQLSGQISSLKHNRTKAEINRIVSQTRHNSEIALEALNKLLSR